MAESFFISAFIGEAVKRCFDGIGRYISYTRRYKRNIENLKEALENIEGRTGTILAEVLAAKRNGEDIRPDVLGWLQKFEELKSQVNEFVQNPIPFRVSCLSCSCPNLRSRYLASTEATNITSMINLHLERGTQIGRVGQEPVLGQMPLLSPGEFYHFESRVGIMEQVMNGLKDDSISMIGLCGMGGIGKTMLVKKIADEVKNENLFDEVAFVVVPKLQNEDEIQYQLASRLGLRAIANETGTLGRALLLRQRLMNKEKKTLVILDDMWNELDLKSVGIPTPGERSGLKILMTSRFDNVCTIMKVQMRLEVDFLSNEEAWNLFKMTAGVFSESISHTAQEVSQECAGLPLAIVTVGTALGNRNAPAFRDVLDILRDPSRRNTSRFYAKLYECIKSSFDYLESGEHRSILLLCSLYPDDYEIPVEDLVRYARGLFDNIYTMAAVRDRVEAIIEELMKCYLLLLGERKKCFKLHDVVRDVCLSIASGFREVYISLKFDDLRRLSGLNPQTFRLLRLVNKEAFWKSGYSSGQLTLEEIMNEEIEFPEGMQGPRVLEVNHITISLPLSLPFLQHLHTLCLDYCRLQGDLAGIGSLKELRVLSLFHSIVDNFPLEIAKLTNLQCLDLRFRLENRITLALRILSSLKDLEELYLGDIVSGDMFSGDIVHLGKVCSLSKLHTIQFVVKDDKCLKVLLTNLNLQKICRLDIARVERDFEHIEYQIRENMLQLWGKNVQIDLDLLKSLMWKLECFHFNGRGLTNVVNVLVEDGGFQMLKEVMLDNCDMKYLIDNTNHLANGVFNKLETLQITRSDNLEELIPENIPVEAFRGELNGNPSNVRSLIQYPFGNLRRLVVFDCETIKGLFSKSIVNVLGKLEIIEVQYCYALKRIVKIQKDGEVFEFPKLKHLKLNKLPNFISIGSGPSVARFNEVMLPDLEDLTIILCDATLHWGLDQTELCFSIGTFLPKVRYMYIEECNNLFTIANYGLVGGFQNLKTLTVSHCLCVEVVFNFKKIMDHKKSTTKENNPLARLEWLYLYTLPKLRHIWKMPQPNGTHVFRNLKRIEVKKCDSITYLLTPTVTNMLLHLEEIELEQNAMMETIIGRDDNESRNDGEDATKGLIALPKLQKLKLWHLENFRELCFSPGLILEFTSLTELLIKNNPIDVLIKEIGVFQNLRKLEVEECCSLKYLPTSSAKVLVHLEELALHSNDSMEAIFGTDILDGKEIPNETIVLLNLRRLQISELPNFIMLCCSVNLNVELPSLTGLYVKKCPKMKKLSAGKLSVPWLKNVNYGEIEKEVSIGTFINSWLEDCESMTRCLECTFHKDESCSHLEHQNS